ncbi:MAG: LamG domain-containing protein [Bacteroidetes bacterium]|nr:LamG domain-containing protein [Bacteroidota bacterium]
MKRIISIGLLVGGILFGQNSYSKIKEKIHFKMGMGTAVTYVTGPETLKAGNNNQLVLQREGTPVFFASAPDGKAGGSMLFTTDNGYYHSDDIQVDPTDNFVFEVWAKALITDRKDMDAKHTFGIVSIGDRNHGYNIVQQGDKWFALVGGVKMFEIGNVIYNRWTHLALVADGEKCTLWLNGEKGGAFRRTSQINPGFTVGNLSRGNNQFSGEVYEVRYATFNEGTFNPAQDFLLNYKQIKAQKKQLANGQNIRISKIVKPGFGCVLTDAYRETAVEEDYLIREVDNPSQLFISKDANEMSAQMVLTNGLVSRVFYVSENLACISYKNLLNDAQYLRAVKPEARIKIDDRWIDVGGLTGQPEKSYLLNQWIPEMEANPNAWLLSGISTEKPKARYLWKEKYNARETEWPPKGLHLILHFEAPESEIELKGVNVDVHYELYDGIPVMAKWLTIDNRSGKDFVVEKTECEVLAVTEDQVDRIHVESDYSFALANANPLGSALIHYDKELKPYQAGQTTTSWMVDPEYNTWATHNQAEDGFLKYPHRNLLKSRLPMGPSELVKKW